MEQLRKGTETGWLIMTSDMHIQRTKMLSILGNFIKSGARIILSCVRFPKVG
jgi:hypothetical protein